MKKSSVQIVLLLGIAVTSGCVRYILQSAVAAIAAQIRPSDSPVVAKLLPMGNPKGEGVVVYVRPDASCVPRYVWIWINDRAGAYALDETTRSLTPDLRTLDEASPDILRRVGAEPERLIVDIRVERCRVAGTASLPPPLTPDQSATSDLLYGNVRNAGDWANPKLVVLPGGVDLRSRSRPQSFTVPISSLRQALASLPDSDWPYGRIVAAQQASIVGSHADEAAISANSASVAAELKAMRILSEWWAPS
jgi:hypothetical protein